MSINEILNTRKKEDFQKDKCPDEITLEMLVDFLGEDNANGDRNELWAPIYHVMYELDKFGFSYPPGQRPFYKTYPITKVTGTKRTSLKEEQMYEIKSPKITPLKLF